MTTRQQIILALLLGGVVGLTFRRQLARSHARILKPRQGEAGVRFFEWWYLAVDSACIAAAIVLLVLELLGI